MWDETSRNYTGVVNPSDNVIMYYSTSPNDAGGWVYWVEITNLDNCVMNMSNPSDTTTGLWLGGGNLVNFEGQGDLVVTVQGNEGSGLIQYKDAQEIDRSLNFNSDGVVTISPETHYYEKQQDGTYKITLSVGKLKLENLKFEDDSIDFQYTKIRLPEGSAVVDFSQKVKPSYNSNLIIYGGNESGDIGVNSVVWDSNMSSWVTHSNLGTNSSTNGKSGGNHFYRQFAKGDFYFLFEDIGSFPPKLCIWKKDTESLGVNGRYNEAVVFPGLVRTNSFLDEQEGGNWLRLDVFDIDSGAKYKFTMGGVTLPINTALYYGASGSTLYNYQWQSDKNHDWNGNDATAAVKLVTKEACEKLKKTTTYACI